MFLSLLLYGCLTLSASVSDSNSISSSLISLGSLYCVSLPMLSSADAGVVGGLVVGGTSVLEVGVALLVVEGGVGVVVGFKDVLFLGRGVVRVVVLKLSLNLV